jgi:hypothetical protein
VWGQYSAHLLPTSLLLGYFPENLAVPKESCNFAPLDELKTGKDDELGEADERSL